MITKMKEWNPELAQKIIRTTGKWNILAQKWWKDFYWDYIKPVKEAYAKSITEVQE